MSWLGYIFKRQLDEPTYSFDWELPIMNWTAPPITTPTILAPIIQPSMPPLTNQEKLYREAKVCLGYPQKLDPNVPNLVACASSLSGVLKKTGYIGLPTLGIAGTAQLNQYLKQSSDFEVVSDYESGLIIIAPSEIPDAVLAHGHVGVTGNNGIMSNDSDTGLWREAWTYPKWLAYYTQYGHIPTILYRWKG